MLLRQPHSPWLSRVRLCGIYLALNAKRSLLDPPNGSDETVLHRKFGGVTLARPTAEAVGDDGGDMSGNGALHVGGNECGLLMNR
jgi:hypothetical protein